MVSPSAWGGSGRRTSAGAGPDADAGPDAGAGPDTGAGARAGANPGAPVEGVQNPVTSGVDSAGGATSRSGATSPSSVRSRGVNQASATVGDGWVSAGDQACSRSVVSRAANQSSGEGSASAWSCHP